MAIVYVGSHPLTRSYINFTVMTECFYLQSIALMIANDILVSYDMSNRQTSLSGRKTKAASFIVHKDSYKNQ